MLVLMTAVDTTKVKLCEANDCTNVLAGRQRKYCSGTCRARIAWRRKHGTMDVQTKYGELAKDDQFLRRGDVYTVLKDHPITEQILAGEVTIGYAADELGYSRTAVTRSIAAIVVDIRGEQGGDLEPDEIVSLLGPSDIALPDPDTPEY